MSASNITEDEIREAFRIADKDENGNIDFYELEKFLSKNGFQKTKQELADIFKVVDKNQDQKISYEEFRDGYNILINALNS